MNATTGKVELNEHLKSREDAINKSYPHPLFNPQLNFLTEKFLIIKIKNHFCKTDSTFKFEPYELETINQSPLLSILNKYTKLTNLGMTHTTL